MSAPHFTAVPATATLAVLDADDVAPVRRQEVEAGTSYTLTGLMSVRECARLVAHAEAAGFAPAGLAIGDDEYRVNEKARNNLRVIVEDRAFADRLWRRIAAVVDRRHDGLVVAGLNWRFRIYKYQVGHYFRPHYDRRVELPGGVGETRFSFMIYLNEGFSGGDTVFYEEKRRAARGASRKRNNKVLHRVTPRTGQALVFDHDVLHEGSEVTAGIKYAVRTDLYYAKP
jgi:prolyl 4-hydroxylase